MDYQYTLERDQEFTINILFNGKMQCLCIIMYGFGCVIISNIDELYKIEIVS